MINAVVGELEFLAVFAALGLALWVCWWGLSGGLWRWDQERKARRAEEEAEIEDVERSREWDVERATELSDWLNRGDLPATVMRTYPTPEELALDWARLRQVGYRMDHDPVVLDDGELMVNYSLEQPPTRLRVVGDQLPSPPR